MTVDQQRHTRQRCAAVFSDLAQLTRIVALLDSGQLDSRDAIRFLRDTYRDHDSGAAVGAAMIDAAVALICDAHTRHGEQHTDLLDGIGSSHDRSVECARAVTEHACDHGLWTAVHSELFRRAGDTWSDDNRRADVDRHNHKLYVAARRGQLTVEHIPTDSTCWGVQLSNTRIEHVIDAEREHPGLLRATPWTVELVRELVEAVRANPEIARAATNTHEVDLAALAITHSDQLDDADFGDLVASHMYATRDLRPWATHSRRHAVAAAVCDARWAQTGLTRLVEQVLVAGRLPLDVVVDVIGPFQAQHLTSYGSWGELLVSEHIGRRVGDGSVADIARGLTASWNGTVDDLIAVAHHIDGR